MRRLSRVAVPRRPPISASARTPDAIAHFARAPDASPPLPRTLSPSVPDLGACQPASKSRGAAPRSLNANQAWPLPAHTQLNLRLARPSTVAKDALDRCGRQRSAITPLVFLIERAQTPIILFLFLPKRAQTPITTRTGPSICAPTPKHSLSPSSSPTVNQPNRHTRSLSLRHFCSAPTPCLGTGTTRRRTEPAIPAWRRFVAPLADLAGPLGTSGKTPVRASFGVGKWEFQARLVPRLSDLLRPLTSALPTTRTLASEPRLGDRTLPNRVMAAAPQPQLDPPFRGMINNTHDALLVFEAARRGMIPRVTRRLIDRERAMVQSGAVFVFDEHESGIKRWTDGLLWSPSRILGNFLIYRETLKDAKGERESPKKKSATPPVAEEAESSARPAALSGGELRGRSTSDGRLPIAGGRSIDRQTERTLVGSLTNSYNFKPGGLVKKTMSVTVNGFNQHLVSYYTVDDAAAGRLRSPSTIPELASLEISQDYLQRSNFRFPPQTETGPDGLIRYRGEPEEQSPTVPFASSYEAAAVAAQQIPRSRSVTAPTAQGLGTYTYPAAPYYDVPPTQPTLSRNNSLSMSPSTVQAPGGAARPSSSHRQRYDPYSPRTHGRRQSTSAYSLGAPEYDPYSYGYPPPATAPGSIPTPYYGHDIAAASPTFSAYATAWPTGADPATPTTASTSSMSQPQASAAQTSRLIPSAASHYPPPGPGPGQAQHAPPTHPHAHAPSHPSSAHPRDPQLQPPPQAHTHAAPDWAHLHGLQTQGWGHEHTDYGQPAPEWRHQGI
ncbi:Global transcription regulator sge1 [Cryptotrichosporon argae]